MKICGLATQRDYRFSSSTSNKDCYVTWPDTIDSTVDFHSYEVTVSVARFPLTQ